MSILVQGFVVVISCYLFGWFVCVYKCASARVNSENSLGESVLFSRVGPRTQTQVVRLGGQEPE